MRKLEKPLWFALSVIVSLAVWGIALVRLWPTG